MADGSVKIDIIADDSDIKKKLDGVDDAAEDAAGGLDKLGDSAEDAGKGFGTADVAIGAFIANGLTQLASKVGEAIGSIVALADETREYREDMAKLDSAFTTAGHSTETAQKAYDGFYKILGESDRTVEAVNHLAEMTKSEEELAQWSTICAGVTARFGDSLPIEGLTEAANHTAKLGEVQGPLADALEWAGLSTEDFNKQLAACNSEEERASLITSTLNKEYEAAATEYNELTASTQAARDATNNMEQAQAALGAAIEPVTAAWTNMKANALQWLVDTGLPALQTGWQWVQDHIPLIAVVVGGLTAAWLAFGGAQTLVNGVTTALTVAQAALNAVMNANPIGLIILAITALVAGFMLLWENCEGFRNFWIGLWEGIQNVISVVVDWIKENWQTMLLFIMNPLAGVFKYCYDHFEGFRNFVDNVVNSVKEFFVNAWESIKTTTLNFVEKLKEFFSNAWEGIKNIWNNSTIGNYFKAIWETIKGIFAVIKNVLSGNWSEAWEAIKGIVNTWAEYFRGIRDKIQEVFSVIATWFYDKFTEAKNSIVNAFSNIKEKFTEIWNKIKDAFNISDMLQIGKNLLEGLWNGINDKVEWLKSKVTGVVDKIKSWFTGKDGFDEHSPSKWSEEVAVNVNKGSAVGFEKSTDIPLRAAQLTTDRIKTAVSLENAKMAQGVGVADTGVMEVARAVGMQTAGINSLASEYRNGSNAQVVVPLVLDGRELGRAFIELGGNEISRTGKTDFVLA